jgi:hypothetical protein
MSDDDDVHSPVPRGHATVQGREKLHRIRAAIYEQALPVRRLDEDRVALPDIEHGERHERWP